MRVCVRGLAIAVATAGWIGACGQGVPNIPPVGRDAGYECSDDGELGTCGPDEVCLQNFCYPRCSDTRPCGPLEVCSPMGVCVLRADAGPPPDTGPPDPCAVVRCSGERPHCRNGVCLECTGAGGECGGATPICDVGRGNCVSFAPALCGPCNNDLDCRDPVMSLPPMGCLARSAPEPTERVCVPRCAEAMPCPSGLTCDPAAGLCRPSVGSCTGLRAAIDRRACEADEECAPAGAMNGSGLFPGMCFDSAGERPFCHHPCSIPAHCPEGFTCDTGRGFCIPLPPTA